MDAFRSSTVIFFISLLFQPGSLEIALKKQLPLRQLPWLSAVRGQVPGDSSLPRGDSAQRPTARETALFVQAVSTPVESEQSLACLLVWAIHDAREKAWNA